MNKATDTKKILETLKQVGDVAALAGIRGEVDKDKLCFAAGFELPNGRKQAVYARPADHEVENSQVVTFFSPCHQFKKGFFSGISKEQAIELLRLNEQMVFARYGLWESESEHMIVASVDQILDTLDPPELRTAMWYVAMAADSYEQRHGGDEF